MPNTQITGRVELPDGTTPANAYVRFQMSGFDTDAPDSATVVHRAINADIDDSGNIDVSLWPNQDGVRLTYYHASVVVRNPHANDDTYKLDVLAVPSEGGPYDLNVLLAQSPPEGADVEQYIASLAAAVAAAESAADRAEAAIADSPAKFGAVGDGVADDTGAFSDLEVSATGAVVDLVGKVYKVDAVPTGNAYINGGFKLTGAAGDAGGVDVVYPSPQTIDASKKQISTGGGLYEIGSQGTAHVVGRGLDVEVCTIVHHGGSHYVDGTAPHLYRKTRNGVRFEDAGAIFDLGPDKNTSCFSAGAFGFMQFAIVRERTGSTTDAHALHYQRVYEQRRDQTVTFTTTAASADVVCQLPAGQFWDVRAGDLVRMSDVGGDINGVTINSLGAANDGAYSVKSVDYDARSITITATNFTTSVGDVTAGSVTRTTPEIVFPKVGWVKILDLTADEGGTLSHGAEIWADSNDLVLEFGTHGSAYTGPKIRRIEGLFTSTPSLSATVQGIGTLTSGVEPDQRRLSTGGKVITVRGSNSGVTPAQVGYAATGDAGDAIMYPLTADAFGGSPVAVEVDEDNDLVVFVLTDTRNNGGAGLVVNNAQAEIPLFVGWQSLSSFMTVGPDFDWWELDRLFFSNTNLNSTSNAVGVPAVVLSEGALFAFYTTESSPVDFDQDGQPRVFCTALAMGPSGPVAEYLPQGFQLEASSGESIDIAALRDRATELEDRNHPLSGTHHVIKADGTMHPWVHSFEFDETSDQSFLVTKDGEKHVQSYGAPVVLHRSIDHMISVEDAKSFASWEGEDIVQAIGGPMDGGRLGYLIATRDRSDDYRYRFSYSDNSGVTFSEIDVPLGAGVKLFPNGKLHKMTSFVSGLAADGWVFYAYGTGGISSIHTIDNGLTWVRNVILPTGAGSTNATSEPFVVKLGDDDRWAMMLRDNGLNMAISFSTNLLDWEPPVDTGINLQNAPPFAAVKGDRLYSYIPSRNTTPIGDRNVMYVSVTDLDDVWSRKGINSDLAHVGGAKSAMLGYHHGYERDGEFYFIYNEGEDEQGSDRATSSRIVRCSTVPFAPAPVFGGQSNPNLLRNPYFSSALRGGNFTISGAITKLMDGWATSPSGATGTISQSTLTDEVSLLTPWNGRHGMSIDLTANDNSRIYQVLDGGPDIIRNMSDKIVTVQVWGKGKAPASMYAQLDFLYGSGGSPDDYTTSVLLNCNAVAGAFWYASVTRRTPTIEGKTVGTGSRVQFAIGTGASDNWDCDILGVKLEYGSTPTAMAHEDLSETEARVARFVQSRTVENFFTLGIAVSETSGSCLAQVAIAGLSAVPEITWSNAGTGLRFQAHNAGVYQSSAIAFSSITKDGFILEMTSAASPPAGQVGFIEGHSGGGTILIDAETT